MSSLSASTMSFLSKNFPVSVGESGEELYKKIEPYFGQINPKSLKQSALRGRPVTTYDLPDVLDGENFYIRDTIDDDLFARLEFLTTVIFPWILTDIVTVAWNKFHFNHVLASRVPHRGVSRLVTSKREQGRRHSERRGLAMHLEADFFNTPEGVLHYWDNIHGMSGCIQETQNFDTVYEILDVNTNEKLWQTQFGSNNVDYDRIIDEEVVTFGAMVKDAKQLDITVEGAKTALKRRGVRADAILFPTGQTTFLTMVTPYAPVGSGVQTTFVTINDRGELVQKPGPDALTVYRDANVFEVPEFGVYDDELPIQLLAKNKLIGEYYVLSAAPFRGNIKGYLTSWRDTYLYNMTTDSWEKIGFLASLANGKTWDVKSKDYHHHLKDVAEHQAKHPDEYSFKTLNTTETVDGEIKKKSDNDGTKPYHFLLTQNIDGEVVLSRYFGQWMPTSASNKDFEDVAATIAAHALHCEYSGKKYDEIRRVAIDFVTLWENIENTGYNRAFFEEVINLNSPFSTRNGVFAGEKTPMDIIGKNNPAAIREWKPTGNGSLLLPQRTDEMGMINYPPGFANEPGMAQIAHEKDNPHSTWGHISDIAFQGLRVFHYLSTDAATIFDECLVLDPRNRSPWFHVANRRTTLIQNLFPPRDPIFLAYVPPFIPRKESEIMEEEEENSEGPIKYPHVFPFDITSGDELSEKDIRDFLVNYSAGTLETGRLSPRGAGLTPTKDVVVMKTGNDTILIPSYLFASSVSLPKILKVYSLMGDDSYPALVSIMKKLDSEVSSDNEETKTYKSKFASLLLNIPQFVQQKNQNVDVVTIIRKFVLYLSAQVDVVAKIKEMIPLGSNSNSKANTNAIKKAITSNLRESLSMPVDTKSKFGQLTVPPGIRKFIESSEQGNLINITEPQMKEEVVNKLENLADQVDGIIQLVTTINTLRKKQNSNYVANFSLTAGSDQPFFKYNPPVITENTNTNNNNNTAPVNPAKINDEVLTQQLQSLLSDYNDNFVSLPTEEAETLASWQGDMIKRMNLKNAKRKVLSGRHTNVLIDDQAILSAQYYRCPLTMSLRLLETAMQDEYSLILPSDPDSNHSDYVRPTDNGNVPESVYDRVHYASISEYQNAKNIPYLEQTTFISKLMNNKSSDIMGESRQSSSRPNKQIKAKRGFHESSVDSMFFEEDEQGHSYDGFKNEKRKYMSVGAEYDSDFDDDEFNNNNNNSNNNKKSKSDEGGIRKGGFRDPEGGWTRSNLRRKDLIDEGVDKLRLFESATSYNQEESFNDIYNDCFVTRFHEASKIKTDPILKACLIIFMTTKCNNFDVIEKMCKSDIHVPINVYDWRVLSEFIMTNLPLLKAGLETGANLYGNSNFVISNDGISKMIYGNLTFYSKAIAHREENIFIIPNVAPLRHVGGHNCTFIKSRADMDLKDSKKRPSIIATLVPITETIVPSTLSITGQLPVSRSDDEDEDERESYTYSTAEFYEMYYRFSELAGKKKIGSATYFDRTTAINTVAKQGHQWLFNKQSEKYDVVVEGKGHLGRNGSGPGAAAVWNGSAATLPRQVWSEYNLV